MKTVPAHKLSLFSLPWKQLISLILGIVVTVMRPVATYAQTSTHDLYDVAPLRWENDPTPYYANMLSYDFKPSSKQKRYSKYPKTQAHKSPKVKEHPRKKLLEEAPLHTQRAWLYSAVVPGLGQCYNESYWKLSIMYPVFGLLIWGAWYNHKEYTTTRREILNNTHKNQNLTNYMRGRERDRTIFLAAIVVWYILNVFDAYVEGSLKTFDVSDDLAIVIQEPTTPPRAPASNAPMATGVSLNISLKAKEKDEDRNNWIW